MIVQFPIVLPTILSDINTMNAHQLRLNFEIEVYMLHKVSDKGQNQKQKSKMTSVNSTNYGSIHISDDRDQSRGEREKTGGGQVSTGGWEETYQELLPQPESWKSRHKQFIGE